MFTVVKRTILKFLSSLVLAVFKFISFIPFIGGFGKQMYASGLFGRASGMYFGKNYKYAISAYETAINYAQGMEDVCPLDLSFEQAYLALAEMYEKGLGVDKDEMKAEEYYLRAGSRGDTAYEHKVATRSWYEKNWM